MEALSAALDELYGGSIEPFNRKKGETQCVGFIGSFLDDAYTTGERILEPAAALMGDILLRPATENGLFRRDYIAGERQNLIHAIQAQMNEKRQYAQNRLIAEMCAGEPFGVDKLGTVPAVEAITPEGLWAQYQTLLSGACIELYYCGCAEVDRVAAALAAALDGLPAGSERPAPVPPAEPAAPETPRFVEEALDVTQGKLTFGFRTGVNLWDEAYPAMQLLNAVYGGTTTSKLFMNVREKLSLCYYASSGLMGQKGILMVSSGVEFDQFARAKEEILAQLQLCQDGAFDDSELEGARRSVISSLLTMMDSQRQLEDYWLSQSIIGTLEPPAVSAARLEQVTREQVIACARRVTLDTVYFLTGKGA